MVKRIVMMNLLPGTEGQFLEKFETVRKEIRNQRGCKGLELLRGSEKEETSFCTISLWLSVDDLETYRASPLFQKTWAEVRPLFSNKARVWTLDSILSMP